MSEPRAWIVGSDPDCDLVVGRRSVSWHHCRLTRRPDGSFVVEDLNSRNGTYVNGRRVVGPTPVRPGDAVTLGRTVPMPWPPAAGEAPTSRTARVVRLGREPGNDVVIDHPEVSGWHARVLVAAGGREAVVEDLGSTNGTSVGAPGHPVARASIGPGDTLYLGTVAFPAAVLFGPADAGDGDALPPLVLRGPAMTVGRDRACDLVIDFPVVSARHARLTRGEGCVVVEDLGSSNGTFVNGVRADPTATARPGDLIGLGGYTLRLVEGSADLRAAAEPASSAVTAPFATRPGPRAAPARRASLPGVGLAGLALGGQAGLLAEGIVLVAGRSPAAALFGMALAAVWVGLTSALFVRLLSTAMGLGGTAGSGLADRVGGSLARAALFDLFLCAVLLGVAVLRLSFGDRWLGAFALLWLTALVGSAVGLVLARLVGRPVLSLALAVALVMMMAGVGGPNRPLPRLNRVARATFAALPTRWAFEGLLLAWAGGRAEDPADDPVEPYFPAETDRTGVLGCASALLALLGGCVYLDALSDRFRPDPPPPEPLPG